MPKKATNRKKTGKRRARAPERKIAHAVNHPVRLDALSILFERTASPKEIAKLLRVTLANVSFHVAELAKDGAIELVGAEPRRGALEHYYRAKLRPEISDAELKRLPKAARREFAGIILQAIVAESLASLRHGKMDADDELHLSWMPMRLDAEGRREVSELQAEMLERLEAVKERSASRLPEGGKAASVRIVAMMGFERGGRGGRPPGDSFTAGDLKK